MNNNTIVPIIIPPILVVISGPTATGKSALALALADRLPSSILSADSRQVYREFNIGTAKPGWHDRQQVPHYLIDICHPTETLTLADYQAQAQGVIDRLHGAEGRGQKAEGRGQKAEGRGQKAEGRRQKAEGRGQKAVEPQRPQDTKGDTKECYASAQSLRECYANSPSPLSPSFGTLREQPSVLSPQSSVSPQSALSPQSSVSPHSPPRLPLLVGGTGLYIKSIVRGLLIPRVAPQPALRSQLQALGQPQCYAFLRQVDPVAAEKIHPHDAVRTLRALEVFYVTGQPISQQQGEQPPSYAVLHIGLDCASVEGLQWRIEQRTAEMMAAGLVAEVERLCGKYGTSLPLLETLGYREIKQYLQGDISLGQAEALTVLHTRQFAKQQRTWFRADRSIAWYDADAPDLLEQVWQRVQQFMAEQPDPP